MSVGNGSRETRRGQTAGPIAVRPSTPLDAALWALDEGLWPVPITPWDDRRSNSPGKAPIGRSWGVERPDPDFLRATFKRVPKAGVGLKLGADGTVIDIDVDDPSSASAPLARIFPDGPPPTLRWANAEGRFHLLFRYDPRLAAIGKAIVKGGEHYPGMEVRIGAPPGDKRQIQSVIPPSLMASGVARKWVEWGELLTLPESVVLDLEAHAIDRPEAPATRPSRARSRPRDDGRWTPEARAVEYIGKCEPAVSGQHGHDQTLKVCVAVGCGFDLDPDLAFGLLSDLWNPTCQPPWTEKDLRRKVEEAYRVESRRGWLLEEERPRSSPSPAGRKSPRAFNVVRGDDPAPERPSIVITPEEHEVIDLAVGAIGADDTIYQRGNMLVTILHGVSRADKAVERPKGTPRIAALPSASLRERMTRFATWHKLRKTRDGGLEAVPSHPPDWAVSGVSARGEWPRIRPIEAVVEAPTMRPDGSILDRPGWDRATFLYYEPNADFPEVPTRPTRDDARGAAEVLLRPVVDFPFADDCGDGGAAHRSAWLAAMLTPLARFAIDGPCPLFAFDANAPGSGKTKLTDLIAIVNTGRDMPRTAYPESDEEMRKRITSIALAGDRMVLIDNIASTFGGSSLDSALTASTWRDRILGRSELVEMPLFTVWFATGNNLALRGDVLRRVVPCRLESPEERPEERTGFAIEGDLLDYARRERPRLVAAGLTLLRAHAVAGRPDGGLPPLGSFESWSRVVRSAVHWATGSDPCTTRDQLRESDPETIARNALIEGWAELPGSDRGLTASEALQRVKDSMPPRLELLRSVLREFSQRDELPTAKALGVRLKKVKDRVVAGRVIRARVYQGTQVWRVETVGGSGGTGGSGYSLRGENSSDSCNTNFGNKGLENSHDSNHSHQPSISEIRETVAGWPEGWMNRFGAISDELLAEGYTWPADEIEAFAKVSAERRAEGG